MAENTAERPQATPHLHPQFLGFVPCASPNTGAVNAPGVSGRCGCMRALALTLGGTSRVPPWPAGHGCLWLSVAELTPWAAEVGGACGAASCPPAPTTC